MRRSLVAILLTKTSTIDAVKFMLQRDAEESLAAIAAVFLAASCELRPLPCLGNQVVALLPQPRHALRIEGAVKVLFAVNPGLSLLDLPIWADLLE